MGDHEAQLILMGLHECNDLQPAALRRAIGAAQLLMTSHQGRQIQRHGRGMNAGNHQHAVGLERAQGRRQHGRTHGTVRRTQPCTERRGKPMHRAQTGAPVNQAGAEAARMMRRHRILVTLISVLAVGLTAFYGAIWMLMHPFGY